ncbi:hypothetical protein FQN50_000042 [Emmonsiellopsis sp. PD_5]|nr:hypothetical protein FQN50_000042 [Emmonsiellopsis sp. PD_5]
MKGRPGIGQKRFSHDRFKLLAENEGDKGSGTNTMAGPHDASIDIPLTAIPSRGQTGARKADSNTSPAAYAPPSGLPANSPGADEKNGIYNHGRRKMLRDQAQLEGSEDGTLTRMGRIYNAILNFSVVTRYFIYVSPLALLIAIPIIVGATAAPRAEIGGVRIVWFFTWVEVVWLSLWVSKTIAHYIPFVFQFLCGIVSSGTRKYALILKALEIPFSLVGWSVTSLATFIPLMTRNPDTRSSGNTSIRPWQNVVKNLLFAAFISALILAAEKVLVQLISISYHRKQFDMRIKESKRHIHFIGLLYEASRTLFPEYCKEFEDEDYVINDSIVGLGKGPKGHKRVGSASPMRLIHGVGRVGDRITAAFGNVAHEITGKRVFDPTSAHSVVTLALEKRKSSEALARRLWMSFVLQGREALYPDDIIEVLGPGREAEAAECFAALDNDENGDVSLEEMILKVAEIGRVKQSINNSMHDVDQAIHVLDNLLCTVVFILVILVFIAFLNSGFGTTLAAGATALLSLSFVFATTCQEVLGSCIFLFVKHPYDVGDRVDISGNQLIVERISLLFTVFRSVTEHKTTQVPNIVLNSNWVENVTRSKAMREQIKLTADFGTSFGDIQLLKAEMQNFVLDKENRRDFQPDVDIEVIGLGDMNKLELRIEIRHKSNWSNETVRAARRSKFMCALVLAIRKVPIYGPGGGDAALGDISRPSYSVAISPEQAQSGKDEYASGKEGKRLVPTEQMDMYLQELNSVTIPPKQGGKSSAVDTDNTNTPIYRGLSSQPQTEKPSIETTAIQALHSRPPGMDQARMDESDVLRPEDPSLNRPAATGGRSSNDDRSHEPLTRETSTGRRTANPLSPNTPVNETPYAPTAPAPAPAHAPSSYPTYPPQHQQQQPPRHPHPQHQHQQAEYHEYATPYAPQPQSQPQPASRSGRESPYSSNNPYAARPSPTGSTGQLPLPVTAGAPGAYTHTHAHSSRPGSARAQTPPVRRPVGEGGNGNGGGR